MTDAPVAPVASVEPVIAPLPTPLAVEPRTAPVVAPLAEAAEIARQAEEAKLPKPASKETKDEAKKEAPPAKLSTREALRAAREKVEAEPASPLKASEVAKAAEPAAKAADPALAKPDSAKAAEPTKAADAVTRAPDGKFVSTDPAKVAEAAKAAEPVKETPKAALPSHTANPPPARFADAAKAKWAEAPEEVRVETERAITELTKGFEKHRADATAFNDYKELHDIAKTHGHKSGAEVFRAYYEMENALRNPETRDKTFEALFQKLGTTSRAFAEKVLGQAPDAAASQADATITELRNEIAELKKGFGEIHAERTQVKTDTTTKAVTEFAAAHPRFDELADDIAFFLKTRHPGDLAKAYEAAERLNPASPSLKEPEPAKEAPAASTAAIVPLVAPAPASTAPAKSIAGAPTAGSDPARKQPSSSIKEALKRARQAAG